MRRLLAVLVLLFAVLSPSLSHACACGCGLFTVGTGSMFPTDPGGSAFLDYGYVDQDRNWSGTSRADEAANEDKEVRTRFFTAGAQYLFNRSWGLMAEVPYWSRRLVADDGTGNLVTGDHPALGDIRLSGVYTGFSPDMSAGLRFGLKLPTGDSHASEFDHDNQIGTGSTDLLLGGYKMGRISGGGFAWFASALLDQPVLMSHHYQPGTELNAGLGSYYEGWTLGGVKVAPLAQVVGTYRWSDGGEDGHAADTGYRRLLAGPGLELQAGAVRVYSDVGFPIVQDVNGQQLVSGAVYRLRTSIGF